MQCRLFLTISLMLAVVAVFWGGVGWRWLRLAVVCGCVRLAAVYGCLRLFAVYGCLRLFVVGCGGGCSTMGLRLDDEVGGG